MRIFGRKRDMLQRNKHMLQRNKQTTNFMLCTIRPLFPLVYGNTSRHSSSKRKACLRG